MLKDRNYKVARLRMKIVSLKCGIAYRSSNVLMLPISFGMFPVMLFHIKSLENIKAYIRIIKRNTGNCNCKTK